MLMFENPFLLLIANIFREIISSDTQSDALLLTWYRLLIANPSLERTYLVDCSFPSTIGILNGPMPNQPNILR